MSMNIVILAGGNQRRFGYSLKEKSKVLLPIGDGKTILSNILDQLPDDKISRVVIAVADKEIIADFIEGIRDKYSFPIDINRKLYSGPIDCLKDSADLPPVTFILGDTYFPGEELKIYMNKAIVAMSKYDGFVGASYEHVGDGRVIIKDDEVTDMSHDFNEGLYCCGLFTIYDKKVFSQLEPNGKYAHTWALLPKLGYKLGYYIVGPNLLDLDTPEEAEKLQKILEKE